MKSLPTLRRKILRSFSVMILMYAGLGVFLVISVFVASGTTPKLIHVNYDSIVSARQMNEAWNGLRNSALYQNHSAAEWRNQFESALHSEEGNITEVGEQEVTQKIRKQWNQSKEVISAAEFQQMNQSLDDLVKLNEKGMFGLAQRNQELNRYVLVGSVAYFLITLILAFFLADGLANRLSFPLKRIAEALTRKPELGKRLRLVEPNSLEMLILTNELERLWERVTQSEKVNVKEIVQQKIKLETLLESVDDGLLVIDPEGRVSHCNSCMLRLFGLAESQIIGHSWIDLPTANENYMKLRGLLRLDMPDSQETDLLLDESMHQFAARFRKIMGPSEANFGILYLLHDITEKRQRDRFRAEFIDLLSHELKTPLQSLGTAAELLTTEKAKMSERSQLLLETITEDVERIRAVANEFVQVTQSHSKILKLRMDRISLNSSISEWIKPFRVVAKDKNVELQFLQEGSDVIWAKIDQVKFPWVISNLLSNAIRFSPEGGVVELLLTDANGAIEIKVRDEGPGVPVDDRVKIFEPFFQGGAKTGKKGLFGLGLTIAKEVVEAHDGRLEYRALEPNGSEFQITLPFPDQMSDS